MSVTSTIATIASSQVLSATVINSGCGDLPIDSRRILNWSCAATSVFGGCGGTWKESVVKRARYTKCPKCEPRKKATKGKTSATPKAKTSTKKVKKTKTCSICYEEKPDSVTCLKCGYECCRECLKRSILEGVGPARCIAFECAAPLKAAFLCSVFSKTWYTKEYLPFLGKIDVEHEHAQIPHTMGIVQVYKQQKEADKRVQLAEVAMKRFRMKHKITMKDALNETDSRFLELCDDCRDATTEYYKCKEKIAVYYGYTAVNMEKPKQYIQGCPKDGCNGLIEADFHLCAVCSLELCKECRVPRDNKEHKCNPSDISTVKSFKGNTKACPKCAALVYKIDGCDQMWCVGCRTSFSWTTLRIETGIIHNPEYFAYLRSNNINIPQRNENVCGEIPSEIYFMSTVNRHIEADERGIFTQMRAYARSTNDMMFSVARRNMELIEELQQELHYRRAMYVLGESTKESWESKIIKDHSTLRLLQIRSGVLNVLEDILSDLFIDFVNETKTGKPFKECLIDLRVKADKVREMLNAAIIEESTGYSYDTILVIGPFWDMMSYRDVRAGLTRPKEFLSNRQREENLIRYLMEDGGEPVTDEQVKEAMVWLR